MSVYLVFRDSVENFMPVSFEYIEPSKYFEKNYGAESYYETNFLNNISSKLTEDDTVIWFVDCGKENVEKLANCKARKILRAVDPSKSDKKLYKNQLALHEKVGFEAFAICYPNEDHIKFLEDKGIRVIVWPHSLDFSDSNDNIKKTKLFICAGQQHQEYYPDRWKLMEILVNCFPQYGVYLPHPGYELDNLAHPYVGKEFLKLLENFCLMPIGVGINDGLHMKFIEAAYSNVLPVGLVPSYIPEEIAKLVPFYNLDPNDYVVQDIVTEIQELFNNQNDFIERVQKYKQYFRENYNLPDVLEKVAKEILD